MYQRVVECIRAWSIESGKCRMYQGVVECIRESGEWSIVSGSGREHGFRTRDRAIFGSSSGKCYHFFLVQKTATFEWNHAFGLNDESESLSSG